MCDRDAGPQGAGQAGQRQAVCTDREGGGLILARKIEGLCLYSAFNHAVLSDSVVSLSAVAAHST